ncbi:MAG: FadR family transcriptional regulator [Spirochaetales bacterium]|jgi:DNA-binding FadR family transcriptional regulator|nr:FadR family transcriptional regulator [Spirochaetales bacterium]
MNKIDYTVTKTNLYEQIADILEQAILRDTQAQRLPSEMELSRRFNVSRTVIREALKVLKERGLIQSRNGEGSYISKPNTDTVSNAVNRIVQMDNISNDDLHNMRLILETAGVRLAALNAAPDEIEHLQNILRQMDDESLPWDRRVNFDAEFHITLAQASRNDLLGVFIEVMTMLLSEYMSKGIFGSEGIKKTLFQHRKILEAIRSKDPDAAEEALRRHLAASRENVGIYERETKTQKSSARKRR